MERQKLTRKEKITLTAIGAAAVTLSGIMIADKTFDTTLQKKEAVEQINVSTNVRPAIPIRTEEVCDIVTSNRAIRATDSFMKAVAKSGLFIPDEQVRETIKISGVATIVYVNTTNTNFQVNFDKSHDASVHHMEKFGCDTNGVPRDPVAAIRACKNPDVFAALASQGTNQMANPNSFSSNTTTLVQELGIGGTNSYKLERVRQLSYLGTPLPLASYEYVRWDYFRRYQPSRPSVLMILRTDTQTPELTYFDSGDFVWREVPIMVATPPDLSGAAEVWTDVDGNQQQ